LHDAEAKGPYLGPDDVVGFLRAWNTVWLPLSYHKLWIYGHLMQNV